MRGVRRARAQILYGNSPHMSAASIPLLVYHPTQIMLHGALVPYLRDWLQRAPTAAGAAAARSLGRA